MTMAMLSNNKRRISTHHFGRFHSAGRRGEREPYGIFDSIYTSACDYQQRYDLYVTYDHMKILWREVRIWRGNP